MFKKTKQIELPETVKLQFVDGKKFIEIKAAARLAGIHPVVLEMGRKLLENPDGQGGVFLLATEQIRKQANEIEQVFRRGLQKVAKTLGPGGLAVKSYRDEERLVFWYARAGAAAKGKRQAA